MSFAGKLCVACDGCDKNDGFDDYVDYFDSDDCDDCDDPGIHADLVLFPLEFGFWLGVCMLS